MRGRRRRHNMLLSTRNTEYVQQLKSSEHLVIIFVRGIVHIVSTGGFEHSKGVKQNELCGLMNW